MLVWQQAAQQRPALSRAEQAIAAQKAALEAAAAQASQGRPGTPPPPAAPQQQQQQPRPNADDAEFDDATRAAIAASLRDLQVCLQAPGFASRVALQACISLASGSFESVQSPICLFLLLVTNHDLFF